MPKIQVDNLEPHIDASDLRRLFEEFGTVENARIINRHDETGRSIIGQSAGFGFVDMPNLQEAEDAINQLNYRNIINRRTGRQ